MAATTDQSPLMTYDEAADRLGIHRTSVKQLVTRGRLHSMQAPEDRRRRLLMRAEVEDYAREHAGKWSYEEDIRSKAVQQPPQLSKEFVVAGAASVGVAALLMDALRKEPEGIGRLVLIGALVALAAVLILELRRQGKLNEAKARHLEQLTQQAETNPDLFLKAFDQLLTAAS
jgi:excisionase family DNA binding protein